MTKVVNLQSSREQVQSWKPDYKQHKIIYKQRNGNNSNEKPTRERVNRLRKNNGKGKKKRIYKLFRKKIQISKETGKITICPQLFLASWTASSSALLWIWGDDYRCDRKHTQLGNRKPTTQTWLRILLIGSDHGETDSE